MPNSKARIDLKPDIRSLTADELKAFTEDIGEKLFRAAQIYEWLHLHMASSYDEMTNIPKALRSRLAEEYGSPALKELMVQESALDGTRKYLFGLRDGGEIESVFMKYRKWNSVCISSQAGCEMGCAFCASTIGGLIRNLTAGEMLSQVYDIMRLTGEKVSRVVVMGSGEPLKNYDNLIRFIRLLTDEKGQGLSQRNITVSTCGIVEGIYALAEESLSINLAISLHAPNDEKRRQIMPVALRYDMNTLMEALRFYFDRTGRQLTFEYALMGGFNDTPEDAAELVRLLSGLNCVVNLIPVNPVRGRAFKEPEGGRKLAFKNKLEKSGINVTIRREMGRDIDGACGQLRARYKAGISKEGYPML